MTQEILDIGFSHDRTTGKEDWLTPPEIIRALGPFDLDPCSPIGRPWDTATKHYTLEDNVRAHGRHRESMGTGEAIPFKCRDCAEVPIASMKNPWTYLRANSHTLGMKSSKELRRLLLLALDRIHELEGK